MAGGADTPDSAMVHVFFGTQTGNAEEIARRIASELPSRGCAAAPVHSLAHFSKSPAFPTNAKPVDGATFHVVVVASTTGDGDPPDAIRPFMRHMRKCTKDGASLAHVRYALLGLGDTNYENFCNTAKKIDTAFIKSGAKAFLPRGLADDGTGLEDTVEPWIKDLYPALAEAMETALPPDSTCDWASAPATGLSVPNRDADDKDMVNLVKAVTATELGFDEADLAKELPCRIRLDAQTDSITSTVENTSSPSSRSLSVYYEPNRTVPARVVGACKLTADDALKQVYHLELDCSATVSADVRSNRQPFSYNPGDAFGILVENDSSEVERLLSRIADVDKHAKYTLRPIDAAPSPSSTVSTFACGSARAFLSQRVNLRATPKKTFLRALSTYCIDPADRKTLLSLCARSGRAAYSTRIVDAGLGALGVLEKLAPSCRPPLSLLLDQLPPLAPRYYSAASAPEADGAVLHFAFSVVRGGLATPMLASLAERFMTTGPRTDDDMPDVLLNSRAVDEAPSAFRPPVDFATPYVMVGPGTGVAPFRGFLRQRASVREAGGGVLGRAMLFYGCRHAKRDYLYADELRAYEAADEGFMLDTAFSRDGEEKVYVQERMEARGEEVAEIVRQGGTVFVCGDGGEMAAGVDAALRSIVARHVCGGDEEAGKAFVMNMATAQRYVRDIWYFGALGEDDM